MLLFAIAPQNELDFEQKLYRTQPSDQQTHSLYSLDKLQETYVSDCSKVQFSLKTNYSTIKKNITKAKLF